MEYSTINRKNKRPPSCPIGTPVAEFVPPPPPPQKGFTGGTGSRRVAGSLGKPRSRFTGRVYPNGEFTLGYISVEKKKVADSRYERGVIGEVMAISPEPDEVDTTLGSIAVPQHQRVFSPLNLAVVQNHHTSSVTYGLKGITTYGKRMVRNAGFLMQEEFGREALSMGTLTIPQFTHNAMSAICQNWGYLVRTFFQEMKRLYEREGLTFRYCSVSEIQPKRWKNHQQVGLHIHFLWVPAWVDWAKTYLVSYNDIRAIWRRLLQNVIDRFHSTADAVPTVPNPNFRDERVRKDAAGYMAKYMSKGSDITHEVVEKYGADWIPAQWWSADSETKKLIQSRMLPLNEEQTEHLVDICEGSRDECVVYVHEITVTRPSRPDLTVGYCGRLTTATMAYLRYLGNLDNLL